MNAEPIPVEAEAQMGLILLQHERTVSFERDARATGQI
jgi:hypothetical protein